MIDYQEAPSLSRDQKHRNPSRSGSARPSVQAHIRKGSYFLQARRFEEALKCFENAQDLDPDNAIASMGANRALRTLIPRWHFAMLNDLGRNHAFAEALREAVTPETFVLDIGSGSGLLAMLAARYGAAHVVSCEVVLPVAQLAAEIVTANGLEGRVQIVPKLSFNLVSDRDIPRKADLIVTEIFDCSLLGEGIIPTVRHARQHLLRDGGHMIPKAGRVFATLVESEQVHKLNHVDTSCGLDVSLFNRFSTLGYFPVRLNTWHHRLLAQPREIFDFDFLHDALLPQERDVDFVITHSGRCHGVVFWFELDLNERISISNDPHNTTTHWMQAVQCLAVPLDVAEGDVVYMTAGHNDTTIWFTPRPEYLFGLSTSKLPITEGCNV
ncbi:MAG: 50S ribosomal protein L11 methyltransferase [Candidatus Tectomicrobia bacterium]|nr:50S ribosomal protein L11 methyltransferase [Candidatus Tectomicrobia bacterium]